MVDSTEQGADNVVESRTALVRFAQTRPLTLFFLLTYGWTWTLWLGVGSLMPDNKTESYGELLVITGAFGPTVAALIARWLAHRDLKICRVWTGWYSLATGLAFGLGWSTYAFNYSTLLGGPLPEEPGWRGFALPRLQQR
jgi:uncharacterized protein